MVKPLKSVNNYKKRDLNRIITYLVGSILVISTVLFLIMRNNLSNNLKLFETENMISISKKCDSLLFDKGIYLSPDTAYFVKLKNIFYYGFVPLNVSKSEGFATSDLVKSVNDIQTNLVKSMRYNSNIQSVYVVIDDKTAPYAIVNGRPVEINNMNDRHWYQECFRITGNTGLIRRQIETSYLHPVDVITVYHKITSTNWRNGEKVTGYIVINYYEKHIINEIVAMLDQNMSIIIYDNRDGSFIFSSADNYNIDETTIKNAIAKLGTADIYYDVVGKNTERQIYMVNKPSSSPLYYIILKDAVALNELISKLNTMYMGMIVICILMVLIFRAVSYYQYKRYVEGIVQVIRAIDVEDEGKDISLLVSHVTKGGVDFQLIANRILSYSLDINELKSALYTEHALRTEVEMLYSHAQINSHFLLNTLDTVYWKTFKRHGMNSDETIIIEKLCMILKYALDTPNPFSSLEEEMQYANYYMDIQRIRKELAINTRWYVPPELYKAEVGKLTLQPILENCIQHGVLDKDEISIAIKAYIHKHVLYICIDDNGVGMSDNEIVQMNERFRKNTSVKSRHIGLLNVNRRIQLQYGEQYGLELKKSDMGGLCVVMKLKHIAVDINRQ